MATTEHKLSNRMYRIWAGIKTRCNNQNIPNYKNYGGRGISYDPRWELFDKFYEDMQHDYADNLSIERIDNDADYCKENCRWATKKEQLNNTTRNRWITIDDERKTLAQWIDESGLNSSTVRQRYYTYGWSIKKSLGIGG